MKHLVVMEVMTTHWLEETCTRARVSILNQIDLLLLDTVLILAVPLTRKGMDMEEGTEETMETAEDMTEDTEEGMVKNMMVA